MGPVEVLQLAAAYRHAFANHLQVVSGWIELGEARRAAEYVRGLVQRLAEESELTRRVARTAAADLLLHWSRAELAGVDLSVRVAADASEFDWSLPGVRVLVNYLVQAAVSYAGASGRGVRLTVVVAGDSREHRLDLSLAGTVLPEEALLAALTAQTDFDFTAARRFLEDQGGRWSTVSGDGGTRIALAWPGSPRG
ncbi:MAG: Spo0B domain-containing protein [Clostridia bacterium]|nr:Spo0B domain-containing protein [Clostridia bacterium]